MCGIFVCTSLQISGSKAIYIFAMQYKYKAIWYNNI